MRKSTAVSGWGMESWTIRVTVKPMVTVERSGASKFWGSKVKEGVYSNSSLGSECGWTDMGGGMLLTVRSAAARSQGQPDQVDLPDLTDHPFRMTGALGTMRGRRVWWRMTRAQMPCPLLVACLRCWRISSSERTVKSMTDFWQEEQKRPVVLGCMLSQSWWQGSGMWMDRGLVMG